MDRIKNVSSLDTGKRAYTMQRKPKTNPSTYHRKRMNHRAALRKMHEVIHLNFAAGAYLYCADMGINDKYCASCIVPKRFCRLCGYQVENVTEDIHSIGRSLRRICGDFHYIYMVRPQDATHIKVMYLSDVPPEVLLPKFTVVPAVAQVHCEKDLSAESICSIFDEFSPFSWRFRIQGERLYTCSKNLIRE